MESPEEKLRSRFAERLRRARAMRGLSLRALAEALNGLVSHTALSKYEKGLIGPGSQVLIALGRALNVDTEYFFRPTTVTLSGIEFRKRSNCPKKEVDRIREEAHDFFERYLEIECILNLENQSLPQFDLTEESDLDTAAEEAANQLRQKWNLGVNPIQNLHEELEHAGVKVREVKSGGHFDGFSGWADKRIPIIVLAKHLNKNVPRKRFTAAHELGHLAMRFPENIDKKREERLCNRFAGAFLIPKVGLKEFGERRSKIATGELTALKAEWGLSMHALMFRFTDLGIISPERRKQFDYLYRVNYKWHKTDHEGKPSEPGEWQGSEEATRFQQLVFRAASEELITRSKGASLLGMPSRRFDQALELGV
jgi:Zn-dependent peptidase ImmA (M78 family)/transcriptional regulator with XRE-family HTH domain